MAFGTQTIRFLKPANYGLRAIGHPARTVALPTGTIASKVPVTAYESYRRSGRKRRTLPSPRRIRRRSRPTPCRLDVARGGRGATHHVLGGAVEDAHGVEGIAPVYGAGGVGAYEVALYVVGRGVPCISIPSIPKRLITRPLITLFDELAISSPL